MNLGLFLDKLLNRNRPTHRVMVSCLHCGAREYLPKCDTEAEANYWHNIMSGPEWYIKHRHCHERVSPK